MGRKEIALHKYGNMYNYNDSACSQIGFKRRGRRAVYWMARVIDDSSWLVDPPAKCPYGPACLGKNVYSLWRSLAHLRAECSHALDVRLAGMRVDSITSLQLVPPFPTQLAAQWGGTLLSKQTRQPGLDPSWSDQDFALRIGCSVWQLQVKQEYCWPEQVWNQRWKN